MMRRAAWVLEYESKEVSDLIAPFVLSVRYTDHEHAQSDEVELTLEDTDLLWRTGWYPAEGDRIKLQLGREGEPALPCGAFQVDEVELSAPPRTITVRALAAGIDSSLRTKKSRAFEKTTLQAVATAVAKDLRLSLVGDVSEDKIDRVTQDDETSVAFLSRLAEERGYAFSIRDSLLIFYKLADLEAAQPVLKFQKSDLKTYRFRNTTQHTYIACEVSFFDPRSGQTMTARAWVENLRRRGDTPGLPELPHDISYGDKGDPIVGEWQRFLQTQGTGARGLYDYKVDDWYLDITAAGTAKFQESQGLTVDGRHVKADTYRAAMELGFRADSADKNAVGEVLYENIRCESVADAEHKAAALLHRANRLKATGTFNVPGTQYLCSGVKVTLEGLQRLSGDWLVRKATHEATQSGGYITSAEVSFVP